MLALFRRRARLHIVRESGAAVQPFDWARWLIVGGVLVSAALAWLAVHAR